MLARGVPRENGAREVGGPSRRGQFATSELADEARPPEPSAKRGVSGGRSPADPGVDSTPGAPAGSPTRSERSVQAVVAERGGCACGAPGPLRARLFASVNPRFALGSTHGPPGL